MNRLGHTQQFVNAVTEVILQLINILTYNHIQLINVNNDKLLIVIIKNSTYRECVLLYLFIDIWKLNSNFVVIFFSKLNSKFKGRHVCSKCVSFIFLVQFNFFICFVFCCKICLSSLVLCDTIKLLFRHSHVTIISYNVIIVVIFLFESGVDQCVFHIALCYILKKWCTSTSNCQEKAMSKCFSFVTRGQHKLNYNEMEVKIHVLPHCSQFLYLLLLTSKKINVIHCTCYRVYPYYSILIKKNHGCNLQSLYLKLLFYQCVNFTISLMISVIMIILIYLLIYL